MGKAYELDDQLITAFECGLTYFGIMINYDCCIHNRFAIVEFSNPHGEINLDKIINTPFKVVNHGYIQIDHIYSKIIDPMLKRKVIENTKIKLQDGRTVLQTILDIYIETLIAELKDFAHGCTADLMKHYLECREKHLESMTKRKVEKEMENPTIYESMEEFYRDCYNPLEDTTLVGFTIGSNEYCIKINYDDCLKGRISICQGMKNEFPVLTYAYLTSGHIFFAYCNEGTLVDRCIDILYSEEGERMILDDIYSRYIDCLSHSTNKISDDERMALRQRYIIDREACKSIAKNRKIIISGTEKNLDVTYKIEQPENKDDLNKCFNFDAIEIFNLTHPDKYYFIKSPDVRKYLESINHQFNKAELMYLIYNSHLGYVEKMDAMASELAKGGFEGTGLEWLKEQVISRINNMEKTMDMFENPEPNTVYNVEYLGNVTIPGPLFASADAARQYALSQNHRKNNIRIVKRCINCTGEVKGDTLRGVAVYNSDGILLNCTIPEYGFLIGSNENRFETDITVNIPHPFEKGHIVTDGSVVYYVKEPLSITAMWNNINIRSKSVFDGKNNDFCIDCYCFGTENGTNAEDIVILNCDVRNLTFIGTGSNELTRIASILKVFSDKYSKSEECCEKG